MLKISGSICPIYLRERVCKNANQRGKNHPIISAKQFIQKDCIYLRNYFETENEKVSAFPAAASKKTPAWCYFCFCLITFPQKQMGIFSGTLNTICSWLKLNKSQRIHKRCPKESCAAVKQVTPLYKYILKCLKSNTTAPSWTQLDWLFWFSAALCLSHLTRWWENEQPKKSLIAHNIAEVVWYEEKWQLHLYLISLNLFMSHTD